MIALVSSFFALLLLLVIIVGGLVVIAAPAAIGPLFRRVGAGVALFLVGMIILQSFCSR